MMRLNSSLPYQEEDNVLKISRFMLVTLIIFSFLEILFFPQPENIYGCLTFIVGWILLHKFALQVNGIERNLCLLPYLGLLGLGVTFFWLPLIITFLESKPLTFRFQNPYLTFNNQLINLVMLIAAYRFCLSSYRRNNILQRLWTKLGYFTPPTDNQMWVMGFIGMFAFLFLLSVMGSDEGMAENLGFVGHLCGVLRPFITLPFLILFRKIYGGMDNEKKKFSSFGYVFRFECCTRACYWKKNYHLGASDDSCFVLSNTCFYRK